MSWAERAAHYRLEFKMPENQERTRGGVFLESIPTGLRGFYRSGGVVMLRTGPDDAICTLEQIDYVEECTAECSLSCVRMIYEPIRLPHS